MAVETDLAEPTVGNPGEIDGEGLPKKISPKALPLCSAAWIWSPGNSRSDDYKLHSGHKEWFLWLSFYDEFNGKIEQSIIGRMPKTGSDANSAAKLLLTAFWRFEIYQSDLNEPTALRGDSLSDHELSEVLKEVWG